ncbi:MAG TPA: UpxY family transcription antiterminator [Candidatus Dormibacteraeota bacterium]|nr:UpxY family transcription antiterminator [Candidatus Dormibacteraeota bacterium]
MRSGIVEMQGDLDLVQNDWYAVYTKHQHEKSAAELLTRKGFEVLLPLYGVTHRWKDRVKNIWLPVFPCYLFLRADLRRKLEILRTAGVFWLVENGGRACTVPETDIESVRRLTQSAEQLEPHPYMTVGDRVRVKAGPLTGVEGILVRVKNEYRVVVSVQLLQKAVAAEVDIASVEQIEKWSGSWIATNDTQQAVCAH